MSNPPLNNPNARYWDDLVEDFGFSSEEQETVRSGADRMIAEVRAQRLADVRKRQNATQVEVADAMGVSQARVSKIENGQLGRSEVDTLAAYVKALGGAALSSAQICLQADGGTADEIRDPERTRHPSRRPPPLYRWQTTGRACHAVRR